MPEKLTVVKGLAVAIAGVTLTAVVDAAHGTATIEMSGAPENADAVEIARAFLVARVKRFLPGLSLD